jgi:hypothetical protein
MFVSWLSMARWFREFKAVHVAGLDRPHRTAEMAGGTGHQGRDATHFPAIQNIKRDPFEQNVIPGDLKSLLAF